MGLLQWVFGETRRRLRDDIGDPPGVTVRVWSGCKVTGEAEVPFLLGPADEISVDFDNRILCIGHQVIWSDRKAAA